MPRQAGPGEPGRFEAHTIDGVEPQLSVLELLDALNERLIDGRMWSGVLQIGVVVAVVTLLTMDMFLPGGLIEGSHDLATARTAGFTVLVLAHLFNAFNARSETTSAFSHFLEPLWHRITVGSAPSSSRNLVSPITKSGSP